MRFEMKQFLLLCDVDDYLFLPDCTKRKFMFSRALCNVTTRRFLIDLEVSAGHRQRLEAYS